MVSLVSVASKAAGMKEFVAKKYADNKEICAVDYKQGDIVTTVITCAGGQTITLTLDTTLPRYYTRSFTVRGTKGMYEETTDSILLDGKFDDFHFSWQKKWGNESEFEDEYLDPIWKNQKGIDEDGGHGGIDWLVYFDFIDCVKNDKPMPIDAYDAASLMCISVLSKESISHGGAPVAIPDFTKGMWMHRK